MYLKELRINNFRNCREAVLDFSPNVNCFIGLNGAGKTNLLDAIYYLSFCKSYFGGVENQNILHEENFFSILGNYRREEDLSETCHCILERGKLKQFKLNKKEYSRLSDHIGRYPLVMVSPYDRDLINDGSEQRRRYIDSVISQFDRMYLGDLIAYNKALAQRNALLKRFVGEGYFDRNMLEIWDMRMEEPAVRIFHRRKDFSQNFSPVFQKYYEIISGGKERVDIIYESQLENISFLDLMRQNIEKDRALRYSSSGIHKDDLSFKIDGCPVKYYASQGQQKSFVVAIKLAQFDYIRDKTFVKPILLLDDLFDKLDEERATQLIRLAGGDYFGQVFISDTQYDRIQKLFEDYNSDHRIFEVANGVIRSNQLGEKE
ncbi:MAG: DNA replication and repair protein RecF [Bacteroidales bacterium]|jgi:DNA replication and repair protein RecF|nr:DNA replication and repair protein RecF [Bacteroidales bacterium]